MEATVDISTSSEYSNALHWSDHNLFKGKLSERFWSITISQSKFGKVNHVSFSEQFSLTDQNYLPVHKNMSDRSNYRLRKNRYVILECSRLDWAKRTHSDEEGTTIGWLELKYYWKRRLGPSSIRNKDPMVSEKDHSPLKKKHFLMYYARAFLIEAYSFY